MRTHLNQRLLYSESQEQYAFLRKLADSLLASAGELAEEEHGRHFRDRLDLQWGYSPAPGFSSFTDEDRAIARGKLDQALPALAEQVGAAWHWDRPAIP
jgi:hypothetical protein